MRVAVLIGSFNPLTNAHVAALKAAVSHLDAELGLFVATNGKYLKSKTIKYNDPFYLTEEERREIIDKVCETEDKLAFGGYEMGGVIPSRYKTLCRIRKQYPDAEIYEVQGADKVRTISRFTNGEEYVSNIRFAVFDRNDIDLDKFISVDELLCRYRERFTLLPALDNVAQVSSTEVRRRFYAGEDFSDIVPAATVEVVSRHKPSDFSISYADKMKTIMSRGRFGINNACKQVYTENISIFNDWKNGCAEVEFGDYKAYLDGAKLYRDKYTVDGMGTTYSETVTGSINIDCVDLAEYLIDRGYNPAILNLASAGRAGGGWDRGMHAQEESLCQASNLSLSLYQFADPRRMKCVRDSGVPHKMLGYPLDTNFGGIYTPEVTFFRNNSAKYFTMRDNPFKCDVITVAALSFNGRNDFARAAELAYRSESGSFNSDGEEVMLNKMRTIFRMGVEHGKDSLVLGAFGNGAYRLPVPEVVRLFRIVIEEPEFKNKFRLITFAILESARKPHGLDGKFADYYREFGTYTIE